MEHATCDSCGSSFASNQQFISRSGSSSSIFFYQTRRCDVSVASSDTSSVTLWRDDSASTPVRY